MDCIAKKPSHILFPKLVRPTLAMDPYLMNQQNPRSPLEAYGALQKQFMRTGDVFTSSIGDPLQSDLMKLTNALKKE